MQRALLQNNVEDDSINDDSSAEEDEDEEDDPGANDEQLLADGRKNEYNRLSNMMNRTKLDIKNRKNTVEGILKDDTDLLTDTEKRSNDVKIKSQLRTINEQVNLYKSYNKDIVKICSHIEVETFHNDLSEVLDTSNEIICIYDAAKEREKKINESSNYSALKSLSIDKYIPVGDDKFIRYSSFIEEFKQYVLTRPLKPVVKLNYLKTCLGGEALELVKHYTHAEPLTDAL